MSELDAADLRIDASLFEVRTLMFGCPEDEMDYEYVASLIRCAFVAGVQECYDKLGGPDDLRNTFLELGFAV